jgi:Na+/proline symporter
MFLISDGFLLSQYPSISGPDGVMVPDYQRVFPLLAQQFLPAGLLGLMVTGFLTAFMSSFDTNIHNSTSIVINDIYRPYVANGKSDRHYVRASRVYMALITLVSSIIGIVSQDILKLTMFALAVSLAPGLIKLLRFVWWRVTGRAEAVTQCFSLGLTLVFTSSWGTDLVNQIVIRFFQQGNDIFYITRQVLLMGVSTVVSLIVIFFSRAEPMSHLCSFYGRVRPFGWWGPVRRECANNVGKPDSVGLMLLVSVCGIVLLLCSIFVMTGLLLALWKLCWISLLGVLPSALGLGWGVRKLYPAGTGG